MIETQIFYSTLPVELTKTHEMPTNHPIWLSTKQDLDPVHYLITPQCER